MKTKLSNNKTNLVTNQKLSLKNKKQKKIAGGQKTNLGKKLNRTQEQQKTTQ